MWESLESRHKNRDISAQPNSFRENTRTFKGSIFFHLCNRIIQNIYIGEIILKKFYLQLQPFLERS